MKHVAQLALLSIVACHGVVAESPSGTDAGAEAAAPPPSGLATYELDFSQVNFYDGKGLVSGRDWSFAFALDLRMPVHQFPPDFAPDQDALVRASNNRATRCQSTSQAPLEEAAISLQRGQSTWVESLDLELEPGAAVVPTSDEGACFGYREVDGGWSWSWKASPLTLNVATNRLQSHLVVQKGPIDALKIVFNYNGLAHTMKVTFVAKPMAQQP
ncbi:MAG: hypothetical protein HOO96_24295 [Polyangiaceae bacterium]|nr:hypothetical protein [Polyangiaceae bacterium]